MSAKPDEITLWLMFGRGGKFRWPRDAAAWMKMHPKRCHYLCLKWANKGWYDYGVAADLGWKIGNGGPSGQEKL